jgi:hypothetical protein
VSIPEWWTDDLRDRVSSEAASLMLHLGSHAPDLDEHAELLLSLNDEQLYFRSSGGDVLAVRGAMAFVWRFREDGSVDVAGYHLGRRVTGAVIGKDALPARGERAAAYWN